MKKLTKLMSVFAAAAGLVLTTACNEEPADKVEDAVENAAENVEDAAEKTADAVEDAAN